MKGICSSHPPNSELWFKRSRNHIWLGPSTMGVFNMTRGGYVRVVFTCFYSICQVVEGEKSWSHSPNWVETACCLNFHETSSRNFGHWHLWNLARKLIENTVPLLVSTKQWLNLGHLQCTSILYTGYVCVLNQSYIYIHTYMHNIYMLSAPKWTIYTHSYVVLYNYVHELSAYICLLFFMNFPAICLLKVQLQGFTGLVE